MYHRPVFKFKVVQEYLALEKWCDLDALDDHLDDVGLKQEGEGVIVLVPHDVLNHLVQSYDLVVFERYLNWGLGAFLATYLVLHFVEQWLQGVLVRVLLDLGERVQQVVQEGNRRASTNLLSKLRNCNRLEWSSSMKALKKRSLRGCSSINCMISETESSTNRP